MDTVTKSVAILGAGTAGLLSALALQRAFPDLRIVVIHAPDLPVIGVGESTTVLFPPFLHQSLAIGPQEFFRAVRPSWKLGVRFLWGDPGDSHFNYPFDHCMGSKPARLPRMPAYYCLTDWRDASRCSALMDRGLSPCFRRPDGRLSTDDAFGYHIENEALIRFLSATSRERGIDMIEGRLSHAQQSETGDVTCLVLDNGQTVPADLFLDCSGFASRLLSGVMNVPLVSYADSLFCDTAVVGRWDRQQSSLPYTTAETMDHGWCWQIDFPDHVTRGYVFSSAFCTRDAAAAELRAKNPQVGDNLRFVSFRSGRYEDFWVRNVVALGNASGFVEPLEATALHLVIEQIRLVCRILAEGDRRILPSLQRIGNRQYRLLWDEVRDFLAVHFRFNRRVDTPFWQHCRDHVNLAGASELVELYQQAGPSSLCSTVLPGGHIFGYDGFMNLLIGQRVPTTYQPHFSDEEKARWNAYRAEIRGRISKALPMAEAIRQVAKLAK